MPHKKEKEMEGGRERGGEEGAWEASKGEKFHPVEIDLKQKEQKPKRT